MEELVTVITTAKPALNFRSGPSYKANTLGVFMPGTELQAYKDTMNLRFTKVKNQNGVIGYVMSRFVKPKE